MNDVISFINQQNGTSKWRDYSTPLSRLRCTKNEEFTQILPEEDEWNAEAVEPPIFACKFSQKQGYEHILALANEDGKLAIHNTEKSVPRYGYDAHRNAIFDLAWMFDQMKLVTVSGDHSACLQEVTESDIKSTQIFEGHTRSVKTVAFRYNDSNVFATGGRDGTIITWDARNNQSLIGKVDCCLFNTHRLSKTPSSKSKRRKNFLSTTVSGADSVTGLVFQDENSLISCGAGDGLIKVWDMRKTYTNYTHDPVPKYVLPYKGSTARNGFSNLVLDRSCMKLYANCLDNNIYCYNVGTYETVPHMKYFGHQNATFYIKACLSRDGQYLISGSSDQNAYIWDVSTCSPLIKLVGHQAEVTCVAWCPKNDIVVTCSDDLRHMIWRVGTEELPDNWEVEGAGVAERIGIKGISMQNGIKRTFDKITNFQCSICVCKQNSDKKDCDCCKTVKRLINENSNANKMLKTPFGPRKLFSSIEQNTEELKFNHPLETDVTEIGAPCKKLKLAENESSDKENVMYDNCSEEEEDITLPCKKLKLEEAESIRTVKTDPSEDNAKCDTVSLKTNKLEDNCDGVRPLVADLPNFVIDGRAPHLNISPEKKIEKDWLTKIRVEKNLLKRMQDLPSCTTPPKSPKIELVCTPKSHKRKEICSSPQSPLLKFFKVTSSNNQQCSPKSSNINVFSQQQPQSASLT